MIEEFAYRLESEKAFDTVVGNIERQTVEHKFRVLAIHDVKAIAVRHIFPLRTNAEGKIGTLICASALGFKDYPERNVPVEAFTFQTVFNETKKENNFVFARVHEYGELAKSLRLSNNPEDLIKRAQGIYWALFYQNPEFEKLLLDAYSKDATILPFKIVTK